MFDPTLYREACRELRAPEDKIEEIIAMTENANKKRARRPLRTALICAAAVAMMVVSVAAANPEMVEAFTMQIASIIHVDKYRMNMVMEDGQQVTVFSTPMASVESRGGRAILVIDGEDAADVTDALNRDGRYEDDVVDEKNQMHITVEGTAEDWVVTLSIDVPGGKEPFIITSDSKGGGSSASPAMSYEPPAVSYEDNNTYVSAFEYNGETATPIPEEK